jgi:RimJ/RimL family protein N-acetyltransferase
MVAHPLQTGQKAPRRQVRRARAEDAAAIAAMVASAEDLRQVSPLETYPLDRATVVHWILQRDAGWVIEDRGEIVAYGELVPDESRPDRFWVGHMIVHPGRRGLGLGQRLVHALLQVAEVEKDARVVAISAFADNPRALRCYEACGFVRVDEERVGGRPLVGMRLKFPSRRHSPGPGLIASTGLVAAGLALVMRDQLTAWPALVTVLAMVVVGVLVWRLGQERRDPWGRRMGSGLLVVAIGSGTGLAVAGITGAMAGGTFALLLTCGSATLIWIALLALALRLQK